MAGQPRTLLASLAMLLLLAAAAAETAAAGTAEEAIETGTPVLGGLPALNVWLGMAVREGWPLKVQYLYRMLWVCPGPATS